MTIDMLTLKQASVEIYQAWYKFGILMNAIIWSKPFLLFEYILSRTNKNNWSIWHIHWAINKFISIGWLRERTKNKASKAYESKNIWKFQKPQH